MVMVMVIAIVVVIVIVLVIVMREGLVSLILYVVVAHLTRAWFVD